MMNNEQQTTPKAIVLVSPNGSHVYLVDAVQPQYQGWQVRLIDIEPQPQTNGASQPESAQIEG